MSVQGLELARNKFQGFEYPEANSVFCPNEFFDIGIPSLNGPQLKILGYFIRRTLGWRDEDGNPIEDEVLITSNELSKKAGVGERHVKPSLQLLEKLGFISCVQKPSKSIAGKSAQSGMYALQNAPQGSLYTADLDQFKGFHPGVGNCTFTPNAFFDFVLPTQDHAKSKVIGILIRHTIGYVDPSRPGGRRRKVSLGRNRIKALTGIKSNSTVDSTLKYCIANNFVQCERDGVWHCDPRKRKAGEYSIYFAGSLQNKNGSTESTSQIGPEEALPKTGQESYFPKQAKSTSQIGPRKHFPNRAFIKETKNKLNKQKAAAVDDSILELLQPFFDDPVDIRHLASVATPEQIQNQVDWLPQRNPDANPAGLLRRAIEGNWPKPAKELQEGIDPTRDGRKYSLTNILIEQRDQHLNIQKQRSCERRALVDDFLQLSEVERENVRQRALKSHNSQFARRAINASSLDQPHRFIIQQFQTEQHLVS